MIVKHALFLVLWFSWTLSVYAQSSQQDNPHGDLPSTISCSDCHSSEAWKPLKKELAFNHNDQTSFRLIGRHGQVDCQSCHVTLEFDIPVAANSDCQVCHADVHLGRLGTDCQLCHDQVSFNHIESTQVHMRTAFPLTGAHVQINCASCHQDQQGGAFTPLDTDCYSCHQQDFERTSSRALDHVALGYPTDCKQCHNTMGWANSNFDHLSVSGYPLIGAHNVIRCQDCHSIPSMDVLIQPAGPNDCYSCHSEDYAKEHSGDQFPTTCLSCHNQTNWDDAEFNHVTASNGFQLLGAHSKIDCASCHVIPSYDTKFTALSQNDCYACHQTDYNSEHGAGSKIPTTCNDCHNVNDWDDAEFEHTTVSNGFSLLGAHTTLECASCHVVPGYATHFPATNQNQCYTCHQADYAEEHSGSGFPTDCELCHTVDTWDGADFGDHDNLYFPIFSGKHRGEWNNNCQSCHTNPTNFMEFSCINCHEHRQSEMDDEHRGVSGYTYVSTACYSCHPNGEEGDGD